MMAALIVISVFALAGACFPIRRLASLTCGNALAIEARAYAGMNNKQHTRNFTPSDDALILGATGHSHRPQDTGNDAAYQPKKSCVGLTNSAFRWPSVMTMTGAVDARRRHRSDRIVDPLLERLKRAHSDRK